MLWIGLECPKNNTHICVCMFLWLEWYHRNFTLKLGGGDIKEKCPNLIFKKGWTRFFFHTFILLIQHSIVSRTYPPRWEKCLVFVFIWVSFVCFGCCFCLWCFTDVRETFYMSEVWRTWLHLGRCLVGGHGSPHP